MNIRMKIVSSLTEIDNKARFWRNTGWLSTKCPYCDEHSKKRHFNIRLKDGLSIKYKCFRASCGVEGLLTRKVAIQLGIKDQEVLKEITKESFRSSEDFDTRGYYKNNIQYILGTPSKEAMDYFIKRTKLDLIDNQIFYKIFTSMDYFIKINKIKPTNGMKFIRYKESENHKFIFFLNSNNTMIIYREIDGELKGKVPIIETDEEGIHMPYILKRKEGQYIREDEDNEDRNQLFIAEGVFDIINIYNTFSSQIGTFISSNGFSNINSIIKDFVKYNYKSNVIILSDDDINPKVYKYRHLKSIENRVNHLYVLYNEDFHDYGNLDEIKNIKRIVLK